MWGRLALGAVVLIIVAILINIRFIREDNNNSQKILSTMASASPPSAASSSATSTLSLSSSAFENAGSIPALYTCDGDQTSPPLSIAGVPPQAKSLVLIMDDPDVPKKVKADGQFLHWLLFNIPPDTKEILSGATVGLAGANGAGSAGYTAPCPPKQYQPAEHRYFLKLFALDIELQLPAGASLAQVQEAMQGHVIAQTQLVGRYQRP